MAKKSENQRIIWWVDHPDHTTAVVDADNWEQATVEAAKWWDVPWREVAALCECGRKELLPKFVCSDCGKVFWGRDGSQIRCGLCEAKARDDERRRRTMEERHWREVSRGLRRGT